MRDGEGERWEDVGSGLNFALVAGSLGGTGGQMESPVFACQSLPTSTILLEIKKWHLSFASVGIFLHLLAGILFFF